MARKFFYVCAGMFLLALANHFGASTATAQSGSTISLVYPSPLGGGRMFWVVNRVILTGGYNRVGACGEGGFVTVSDASPPVPGTSPIVGTDGGTATLANGDFWLRIGCVDAPPWVYLGNVLTGVVGVQNASGGDQFGIQVLPNPTRGAITVALSLPTATDVQLEVLDLQGRTVLPARVVHMPAGQGVRMEAVNGSGQALTPGTYFIRVSAGGKSAVSRAVVMR